MNPFFRIAARDATTSARNGCLQTAHGEIQTPVFMPVGTQGTVKTLDPEELSQVGSQIILGNTYHLYLRPGTEVIERAGGLQKFSNWNRPMLTDSGGYQVYSLSGLRKVTDDGVVFQSHIDGSYHHFSPEFTTQIQLSLGSNIMMVLDECPPYPCTFDYALESLHRTTAWAGRCLTEFRDCEPRYGYEQTMFAIVQGSTFPDLRRQSAEALIALDFPGYAIGGLSIGEPKPVLFEMIGLCTEMLPEEKPRYLMGMGKPEDIVEGISLGVDMFDCVLPTRNARKGQVFTWDGALNVRNAAYKMDFNPIADDCGCYTCGNFSRAYLRHLFNAQEILGMRLASLHNLYFYHELVKKCRECIADGKFGEWRTEFSRRYSTQTTNNNTVLT